MSSLVHRPCVSLDFASHLAKKFYNFQRISEIKELSSYSDRNFYVRGWRSKSCMSCITQETAEQREYVLKILNSTDSEHGDFIDAENEAMAFLRARGFPCPSLFLVDGRSEMKLLVQVPFCIDCSGEARSIQEDANRNLPKTDEWCAVRLISFLPGVTAENFGDLSCEKLFKIGQFVGRLSQNFQVW